MKDSIMKYALVGLSAAIVSSLTTLSLVKAFPGHSASYVEEFIEGNWGGAELKVDKISPSSMSGFYEVWIKGRLFYVSSDLNHMLVGHVFDLRKKINLTDRSISLNNINNMTESDSADPFSFAIPSLSNSAVKDTGSHDTSTAESSGLKVHQPGGAITPAIVKAALASTHSTQEAKEEAVLTDDKRVPADIKEAPALNISPEIEDISDFKKALAERIKQRAQIEQSAAEKPAIEKVDVTKISSNRSSVNYAGTNISKFGFDANGVALSPERSRQQISALIDKIVQLGDKWSVKYPAIGEEKKVIAVFTDPTCPFCQGLHHSVEDLNKQGITVYYLLYPRALPLGEDDPKVRSVLRVMETIWCSDDQQAAMDTAYNRMPLKNLTCDGVEGKTDFPAKEHFLLGEMFGLRATPLTITDDGSKVYGFRELNDFMSKIGAK